MAASLLAALLVASGTASAQEPTSSKPGFLSLRPLSRFAPAPTPTKTLHFTRDPVAPASPEFTQTAAGPADAFGRSKKDDDEDADFQVRTDLPGPERLYRRDSEAQFIQRIRQEARKRLGSERVPFPEEVPITKEEFAPRAFPPALRFVEPNYVCHGRLTFEQTNFDRAGYDIGVFQPAVCLGAFCWDLATLPYQYCKRPFQQYDSSAGKFLPGDPVPMLLYPPEPSLSGMFGELGTTALLFLALP